MDLLRPKISEKKKFQKKWKTTNKVPELEKSVIQANQPFGMASFLKWPAFWNDFSSGVTGVTGDETSQTMETYSTNLLYNDF